MARKMTCAESARQALIQGMSNLNQESTKAVVQFQNDDIPKYLKNLARFEEHSKKVNIMVK